MSIPLVYSWKQDNSVITTLKIKSNLEKIVEEQNLLQNNSFEEKMNIIAQEKINFIISRYNPTAKDYIFTGTLCYWTAFMSHYCFGVPAQEAVLTSAVLCPLPFYPVYFHLVANRHAEKKVTRLITSYMQ